MRVLSARPAATASRPHAALGRRSIALTAAVVVLSAACTGHPSSRPSVRPTLRFPLGGTLRVATPDVPFSAIERLDPQRDYVVGSWELFRCCLLRTLLSFEGVPTRDGGAVLRPDLAASLPEVSGDGITWTFHLRGGIHYAPPLQRVEVSSSDVIRALVREADRTSSKGGYSFYYSVIEGFDDVVEGRAQSISGLEAPDPLTLRVHLIHPEGDLGSLFALAATAPIPPNPLDPSAPLGVAQGHDGDDGGFVVATGPYMIQGADAVDFSEPPAEQQPAAGLIPGKAVTLVRNPSWQRSTDPLRPAYVDRIDVTIGGTFEQASKQLDDGAVDLVNFQFAQPPPNLAMYRSSPARGHIEVEPRDSVRYLSMNLAMPPFDDVHVRRAVNLAVDRQAALDAIGGSDEGQVTGHIVVDSLENDLLLQFDPYGTAGARGDVSRARAEMALSRYDRNQDGMCDASACGGVVALTLNNPAMVLASNRIAQDLREIGIDVRVEPKEDIFDRIGDPANHVPMAIEIAWLKDIPSPSTFITPLFSSAPLGGPTAANGNFTLLGASPEQLAAWGYDVPSVPSVDDRIAQCEPTSGSAQFSCWADLDQYLMTQIVPWVPLVFEFHIQIVPARLVHYSFDQFTGQPALDQIALKPGP